MDKLALEKLYADHHQGLFTVALNITRRADAAEDAIHTAFARICNRSDLTGDLTAYIYTAVRNAAIDIHRTRRPTMAIEESFFMPSENTANQPDYTLEQSEQAQLIKKMIDQLPDEQREIIVMKHYTDLTFRQIAHTLGEPLGGGS